MEFLENNSSNYYSKICQALIEATKMYDSLDSEYRGTANLPMKQKELKKILSSIAVTIKELRVVKRTYGN